MVQKREQMMHFVYHFGVLHRGNKDSVAAAHRRSPVSRRDSAAAMLRRSETPIFIGSQKRLFSVDFGSAASLAGPPRAAAPPPAVAAATHRGTKTIGHPTF
jgi:hypothetical protein